MCVFVVSVVHPTIYTFLVVNLRRRAAGVGAPLLVSEVVGVETDKLIQILKEEKDYGVRKQGFLQALVRLNCCTKDL
jgi:hypothetical protein